MPSWSDGGIIIGDDGGDDNDLHGRLLVNAADLATVSVVEELLCRRRCSSLLVHAVRPEVEATAKEEEEDMIVQEAGKKRKRFFALPFFFF